ncbi:MAG: hypothetical protein LBJ12_07655, partial [Oscillospiraceae bacterium]|nr:hypothetical protein [Oscillospiraceae bacterium]
SVLFTAHSHHRHFIDPRHISRTIHLWTAFHSDIAILFGQGVLFIPRHGSALQGQNPQAVLIE